jgi:hypothetical protein
LSAGGDWETKTIKELRGWMYKNGLSSESAFELLLKRAEKIVDKELSRPDFHKAMQKIGVGFSAP